MVDTGLRKNRCLMSVGFATKMNASTTRYLLVITEQSPTESLGQASEFPAPLYMKGIDME